MHTSGLLARLAGDPDAARAALEQLQGAGPFTLGTRESNYVAIALESHDPREARSWHDWARSLPGIQDVEVVFVHWDKDDEEGRNEDVGSEST